VWKADRPGESYADRTLEKYRGARAPGGSRGVAKEAEKRQIWCLFTIETADRAAPEELVGQSRARTRFVIDNWVIRVLRCVVGDVGDSAVL